MRFACDGCNAKYMISDDKVGPAGVKVRCKKCGHVILVHRAEPEAPAAAPEGALAAEWWVAIDEEPVGPVTLDVVQGHWDHGRIGPDSLVWHPGLAEWTAVSGVAELHAHLIGHSADAGSPPPGGFQPTLDEPVQPPPPAAPAAPVAPHPEEEEWRPGAGDALAALEDTGSRALHAASSTGNHGAVPASPGAAGAAPFEPAPAHPASPGGSDPTDIRPLPIQGLERTGERRIAATPGPRGPRAAAPAPREPERTGRPLTVILVVALVIVAAAAAGLLYLTR